MAVKLGNGNWAVKEDKLLAYNDNSGLFFNKEFDFTRGSTATYVGRDGLIASAASGVPRIDFTNDTKGHLLLEPSRTNLVTQSQNTTIGYTHFNFSGGSLIDSYGYKSPDGTNNASRLVYTNSSAGSGGSLLTQNITINATGTYTISLWMKSISGIKQIRVSPKNSGSQGTSGEVFTITNEWKKYSHTFTNDGATNRGFQFRILESDSSGDRTFDVWGMQLEEGDYATSTIPTTGAASTRNADVCNNSGSAQDFNSEEGVLYAEIEGFISTDTVDQNRYITVTNGTSNERVALLLGANPNQLRAIVYSNTQSINLSFTTSLTDVKQFNKLAVKYKSGDYGFFLNGTKIGSSSETSVFTANTLNDISFDVGGGTQQFRGKVRNVQVFTEALTDEQLEKLTS